MKLSWTAPVGDAAGYRIERSAASSGPFVVIASEVLTASYVDSGLEPGRTYWYNVLALNSAGVPTTIGASGIVTTLPLAPPAPPAPTFGSIAANGVTVSWTSGGGGTVTAFRLERAPDESGRPGPWATAKETTAYSSSETGLSPNTTYWYRVIALNSGGASPPSPGASFITLPSAPSAPTFPVVAAYSLDVAWLPPSGGAASYVLERAEAPAGPWKGTSVAAPPWTDGTVLQSTDYWYRVRAVNAAGGVGAASTAATVKTLLAKPLQAGTPTFSNILADGPYVTCGVASGATRYDIERSADQGGAPGAWETVRTGLAGRSYQDTGRTPNAYWWYRCRGTNGSGAGDWSNPSRVRTAPEQPGPPTYSAVLQTTLTVSWTEPPSGALRYRVERGATVTGPFTVVHGPTTSRSFDDSGLAPGTTYAYRIIAQSTDLVDGRPSVATAVTTLQVPPDAPAAPTFSSVTATSVDVTWQAVAGAATYRLERAADAGGVPGQFSAVQSGIAASAYRDSTVTGNARHWYRVVATNTGGDGLPSPGADVVTPPGQPAIGGFSGVGPYSLTVNWAPPTGGAAQWIVERGPSPSGPFTQVGTSTGASFTDAGLGPATWYAYRVRGEGFAGADGPWSPVRDVQTALAPPPPPGTPTYPADYIQAKSVRVEWTAPVGAVSSYEVERADDIGGTAGPFTRVATVAAPSAYSVDGTVQPNSIYWYRVFAVNSGGRGELPSPATSVMTAPAAPGPLSFPAVEAFVVTVAWTESLGGAERYRVERTPALAVSWSGVASTAETSVVDRGVTQNANYLYRVRAVNARGILGEAVQAAVTTLKSAPLAPSVPTFSAVTTTSATVNWTTAEYASGYEVERTTDTGAGPDPAGWTRIAAVGASTFRWIDGGRASNTRYWYRVRGTNVVGAGAWSSEVAVATRPGVPANPTFGAIGMYSLALSWTSPAGGPLPLTYKIERSADAGSNWTFVRTGLGVTTFTDSGLDGDTAYWYRVYAANSGGDGLPTAALPVVTAPAPPKAAGAPTFGAVTDAAVPMTWTPGFQATSYDIQRAPDAGGVPGLWATVGSSMTAAHVDTPLPGANARYWYRILSVNRGGVGPPSPELNVLVAPAAPGTPSVGELASERVALSWAVPAGGATSYDVERAPPDSSNQSLPGAWSVVAAGLATAAHVDTTVIQSTRYYYRVRAANAERLLGPYSPYMPVVTPAAPPKQPGKPEISKVKTDGLSLKWASAIGATSYEVSRAPVVNGAVGAWVVTGTPINPWRDEIGLTPNSAYLYRVRGRNQTGPGEYSETVRAMTVPNTVTNTTLTNPPPPGGLNQVQLDWSPPVGGAHSYNIDRYLESAPGQPIAYVRIASRITSLSHRDTNLLGSTRYWYSWSANNEDGLTGSASVSVSIQTQPAPPPLPPPLAFSVDADRVAVSWSTMRGVSFWELQRAPDAAGAPGAWQSVSDQQIVGGTTSWVDLGRVPNAAYWYRLRAVNYLGPGPYTAPQSVRTLPGAPPSPRFRDVGAGTLTVTWSAPTGGAASYKLQRATDAQGTPGAWKDIATSVAGLSYADSGLAELTTYWYRLCATNAAGDGAWSPAASVTTPEQVPDPPGPPVYSLLTKSTVTVSWRAAHRALIYRLERAPHAVVGPGAWVQIWQGTSTSYLDGGRQPNTRYWYRVRADNRSGFSGPYSAETDVVTHAAAATALAATDVSATSLTLTWAAPQGGALAYRVERALDAAGSPGTWRTVGQPQPTTTARDGGLSPATGYWYRVRAQNAAGAWSDDTSAAIATRTVESLPFAPSVASLDDIGSSSITATWLAALAASAYELERKVEVAGVPGAWTRIASGPARSWVDTGLQANTRYWYRVRGTNHLGAGPWSPESAATTAPLAPGAPTYSDVAALGVTVRWTAPAGGAASYRLERATSATGTFLVIAGNVGATAFVDRGLTPGATYWYRVSARNGASVAGPYSVPSSVTTSLSVPGQVPAVVFSEVTTTAIRVRWSAAPDATTYAVEWAPELAGAPGAWSSVATGLDALEFLHQDALEPNGARWYRVRGANSVGSGPYSLESRVVMPPGSPGTPTFSAVAAASVNVAWAPPTGGAASYRVDRAPDVSGAPGAFTSVATATFAAATDTGVLPGTTYWYRVRALNAAGTAGDPSAHASVRTAHQLPGTPGAISFRAPPKTTSLDLSWGAAPLAASYVIDQALDAAGAPAAWQRVGVSPSATFSSTGLDPGTRYWFRVAAVNASGQGPWSASGSEETAGAQVLLADGTEPDARVVCPGGSAVAFDAFTVTATNGQGSLAGVDVVVEKGIGAVGAVQVRSGAGATLATANEPSGAMSMKFPRPELLDAAERSFELWFAPKSHAAMPPPPGGSYRVAGRVARPQADAWAGADAAGVDIEVDNASPAQPRFADPVIDGTALTLSWTPPADAAGVVLLRTVGTPDPTAPQEGATVTVGEVVGASAVVLAGGATTFPDALTPDTPYYYRLFARDACGNWSVGASLGPVVVPGGVARAEGDPTPDSRAPVVQILNPAPGTVSDRFLVQVRVFSPKRVNAVGVAEAQPITAVRLNTTGKTAPDAFPIVLALLPKSGSLSGRNTNFGGDETQGVWETTLSPGAGRFTLRARVENASGGVNSAAVPLRVNAAGRGDGNLLVRDNSDQLCSDCHTLKTHSSEAATRTDGTNRFGSWSLGCRDCHAPHRTTNLYLVSEEVAPPAYNGVPTPRRVTFWDTKTGDSGAAPRVSHVTSDPALLAAGRRGPCQACHTRTTKWRRDGTGSRGHYENGAAKCTQCHSHRDGFAVRESAGGEDCDACHKALWDRMRSGGGGAHFHLMASTRVNPARSTSYPERAAAVYPVAPWSGPSDEGRRCVACHADHDAFRPDLNPSLGGRGKNLRTGIADPVFPTTGTGFTNTDFDGTRGICTSCHEQPVVKATGSGGTVRKIAAVSFGASSHDYPVAATFRGGATSRFDANCVKCHNDTLGKDFQTSVYPKAFALHDSGVDALLAPLGTWDYGSGATPPIGSPDASEVCLRCHAVSAKPAAGLDAYGVQAMSAVSEEVGTLVAATFGHRVGDSTGTHATSEAPGGAKHVECGDCHDPHGAGAAPRASGTNPTIADGSRLQGVRGVRPQWPAVSFVEPSGYTSLDCGAAGCASAEQEICFKCHSGANPNLAAWGGPLPANAAVADWTDVAREVNPANASAHPVASGSGSRRLTDAQLLPAWQPAGSKRTACSDCHGPASGTGAQGPHGSAVPYVLRGPNVLWPETAGGVPFTLGGPTTGLFCMNCHPAPRATGNAAHDAVPHASAACVSCHVVVPHGGGLERLIGDRDGTMPARYAYRGDRNTLQNTSFRRAATPGAYGGGSTNCGTACHAGAPLTGFDW